MLIEKGGQDEGAGNKLKKILTNDGFIVVNVQQSESGLIFMEEVESCSTL